MTVSFNKLKVGDIFTYKSKFGHRHSHTNKTKFKIIKIEKDDFLYAIKFNTEQEWVFNIEEKLIYNLVLPKSDEVDDTGMDFL